jgi:hypothetical protein
VGPSAVGFSQPLLLAVQQQQQAAAAANSHAVSASGK